MKLNRNGLNNLVLILACIVAIFMISAGVTPQYVFGVIGIYGIYTGVMTIYYRSVPNRKDYSNIEHKDRFCIHTGIWMVLLGLALIGLCVALSLGMDETYFWGGTVISIVLAFFYNFVVNRMFIRGYKSNLEKILDLIKNSRR